MTVIGALSDDVDKLLGSTRIAAPVGHARTQAGPPAISLHMSHLTACLRRCASPSRGRFVLARAAAHAEQQPAATGPASLAGIAAIWMTPYGQLRSQLPQPMQLSSMKTSPFGARWIASGGQSFMQCGSSQCRHEVGTCSVGEGRAGLAVEPTDPVMRLGAGLLAVVAAHAQAIRR